MEEYNLIDGEHYLIKENEPKPRISGVAKIITEVLEVGDIFTVTQYDFKIGEYEKIDYTREAFKELYLALDIAFPFGE